VILGTGLALWQARNIPGFNRLDGVGSATGKEIQGLFVFSVLMRKHLAPQRLALCLNFHLCHQHWEILRVIFGKKDYKRLQKTTNLASAFYAVGASQQALSPPPPR